MNVAQTESSSTGSGITEKRKFWELILLLSAIAFFGSFISTIAVFWGKFPQEPIVWNLRHVEDWFMLLLALSTIAVFISRFRIDSLKRKESA